MNTLQCKVRSVFIFLIFITLYTIVLVNLYCIQILHSDYFSQLGNKQYNITVTKYPPRALIYDRNGKPIALNKDSISAFILPHKIEEPNKLIPFLKEHFYSSFEKLNKQNNKFFLYIKRKLTQEQINLINKNNIEDIKFLTEPSRYYAYKALAPIVGITDIDNNGLFGIEKQFNKDLTGEPSTFLLEKDARSGFFYFKKETTKSGTDSKPITLTIDKDLQFLVYEELKDSMDQFGAKEGAVVIMNPDNGEILAMTCNPTFDPNKTQNLDVELTKHTAITESYELGSVMKTFLALAALEEGIVTPDEIIDCQNTKEGIIDGFKFSTWKAHDKLTFSEVIEFSNNIGVALIAKKLGHNIYNNYKKLGFGEKTNIPLSGEQSGFVNPPKKWSRRSFISLSFGYELTANLLQLARAFSVIANDGYEVQPKLILDKNNHNLENKKRLYSQQSIDQIKEILRKTVQEGTVRHAAIKGYDIMGKTGTANLVIDGQYSPIHNVYTCSGIIQKGDYKRVIVAFIKDVSEYVKKAKRKIYASTIVVPLFQRITEKTLIHDKVLE